MAVVAASSSSDDGTVFGEPNFAVVCSFLLKFGDLCGVADFSVDFMHLQRMLEDARTVHADLIDLHVKLMRRCGRRHVTHDKWEVALVKFCNTYSKVDAWEIERFGYKKSKLGVKVNLLKRLLESQFDLNGKLKTEVNKLTAEELRTVPIGKDVRGQLYWFQVDADLNLRVYREDQDEETFELVVRERNDLVTLIENLVTNTNLGSKKEEDSTTPSDTGDSKDGEGSQDDPILKIAEGNRPSCLKTAEEVEKKLPATALFRFPNLAESFKIKQESEELKVDIKTEDVEVNLVKAENVVEQPDNEVRQQEDGPSQKSALTSAAESLSMDCGLKSDATENEAFIGNPVLTGETKDTVQSEVSLATEFTAPVLGPRPVRTSVIKMVATAEKSLCAKSRDRVDDCQMEGFPELAAADETPRRSVDVDVNPALPFSLRPPAVLVEVSAVLEKAAPSTNDKTKVARLSMPFKKRGIPKDLKPVSDDGDSVTVTTKDVSDEGPLRVLQEERMQIGDSGLQQCCPPSTSGFSVSTRLNADHSVDIMEFMLKTVEENVANAPICSRDSLAEDSEWVDTVNCAEDRVELVHRKPDAAEHLPTDATPDVESVRAGPYGDMGLPSEPCAVSELTTKDGFDGATLKSSDDGISVSDSKCTDRKPKPVISETKEDDFGKSGSATRFEESGCDVQRQETSVMEHAKVLEVVPVSTSDKFGMDEDGDIPKRDAENDGDVNAVIVADCVESAVAAVSSAVDKEREAKTIESESKEDETVASEKAAIAIRGKPGRPRGRASRGKRRTCVPRNAFVANVIVAEDKPVSPAVDSEESAPIAVAVVAQPKKRLRGRPRASETAPAAASDPAAEAVNSARVSEESKPERIQPKRSCRVQAQRVKEVEEHRRIEEALQREAMLVQQRLHEERKRKGGTGGPATTKATSAVTSGSASFIPRVQVKPTNGQVRRGGRRRRNAKASIVKEEAKVAQKECKKTPTAAGRKKRGKLKRVPPTAVALPRQSPAATNGNGGRSKKRKSHYNPWDVSSESSSASASCAEEYDMEYCMDEAEESDEELVFNDESDHEFSPESDSDRGDETWKPAQVKRARTVRRVKSDGEEGSTDELDDDKPCSKCGKYDHPEWILLCDKCDSGFHVSCLRPPLMLIPDGDWFCPPCDHKMLVEKLQEQLRNLDQLWKKKEREEMRKKRLAYVGISLDNVLKPEKRETEDEEHDEGDEEVDEDDGIGGGCDYLRKRSRRVRKEVSYRFKEFDELIDSAIQSETGLGEALVKSAAQLAAVPTGGPPAVLHLNDREVPEADPSKGTIKVEDQNEGEESKAKDEGKDGGRDGDGGHGLDADELTVVPVRPKKKHRRLNDLDSPSDDDDSDEDFKGSMSESEHPSEDESAAGAEDTDDSWKDGERRRRSRSRRCAGGRRQSDDDFIADDSEESEDAPRSYRRAAAKSVNYREVSDSDDGRRGSKKKRLESWHSTGRRPSRIESGDDDDDSSSSEDSDWKKKRKAPKKSHANKWSAFQKINERRRKVSRTIESDDDGDESDGKSCGQQNRHVRSKSAKSYEEVSDDDDSEDTGANEKETNKKPRLDITAFELDSNDRTENDEEEEDESEEDESEEEDEEEEEEEQQVEVKSKRKRVVCVDESDDDEDDDVGPTVVSEDTIPQATGEKCGNETSDAKPTSPDGGDGDGGISELSKKGVEDDCSKVACNEEVFAVKEEPSSTATAGRDASSYSVIKSVESVKKELLLKQAAKRSLQTRPFPSPQPAPQQQHQQNEGSALVPPREDVDGGSLQKLESLAKGSPGDGTQSYQERLRAAPDYHSNRPSPLKPSVVEATTYPVRSSPSKLMLLETGSGSGSSGSVGGYPVSPKLTTLEPYNALRASPTLSGGLQPYDRPVRPPSQFHPHQAPPEYGPYSPVASGQYYSPGAHQYGYQTNPYPQYQQQQQQQQQQHQHSPQEQQHSPNYNYMSHGYDQGPYPPGPQYGNNGGSVASGAAPPHPSPAPPPPYGNYLSPTPPTVTTSTATTTVANEQQPSPTSSQATAQQGSSSSASQPNGRFSIENLLQRRIEGAATGEDDEFSTVNDLVSYITGSNSHDSQL